MVAATSYNHLNKKEESSDDPTPTNPRPEHPSSDLRRSRPMPPAGNDTLAMKHDKTSAEGLQKRGQGQSTTSSCGELRHERGRHKEFEMTAAEICGCSSLPLPYGACLRLTAELYRPLHPLAAASRAALLRSADASHARSHAALLGALRSSTSSSRRHANAFCSPGASPARRAPSRRVREQPFGIGDHGVVGDEVGLERRVPGRTDGGDPGRVVLEEDRATTSVGSFLNCDVVPSKKKSDKASCSGHQSCESCGQWISHIHRYGCTKHWKKKMKLRDQAVHIQLQRDLIEHNWMRYGIVGIKIHKVVLLTGEPLIRERTTDNDWDKEAVAGGDWAAREAAATCWSWPERRSSGLNLMRKNAGERGENDALTTGLVDVAHGRRGVDDDARRSAAAALDGEGEGGRLVDFLVAGAVHVTETKRRRVRGDRDAAGRVAGVEHARRRTAARGAEGALGLLELGEEAQEEQLNLVMLERTWREGGSAPQRRIDGRRRGERDGEKRN
ncbi:hypothetical protein EJB05_49977, partial [Eragrostis curvula]